MANEADDGHARVGVAQAGARVEHVYPPAPTTPTAPTPYVVVTAVVCAVASVWQPAIGIAWIIGFLVWRDLLRAR